MKVRQSSPDSSQICYQAGDLLVDPGIRRVLRGGEDVPLAGLSFDLLMALIRAAPNLVPHERIVQEVWNGQIVSPETLTQRVKLLRDALGDDSQNPRYIAGARGQGYRLIPAVVERPRDDRPGRPRWIAAAALLVVALCLVVYVAVWRPRPAGPTEPTIRGDSIAILPFENRSANREDAFFADGRSRACAVSRSSPAPRSSATARGAFRFRRSLVSSAFRRFSPGRCSGRGIRSASRFN